jgi:type IV secretion system protein VirB10
MSDDTGAPSRVAGERDTSMVNRSLSVQARLSNWLAIGLMSALGLGSLAWYYTSALGRQARLKQSAVAASSSRAQGEMNLPDLGRIDPPRTPLPQPAAPSGSPDPFPVQPQTLPEIALAPSPATGSAAPGGAKSPEQLALERQLSGSVYATAGSAPGSMISTASRAETMLSPVEGSREVGDLAPLLRATPTVAARAQVLPAQRLLLPKGAFIDCTLETAIDSTLPGMTTCVMANDAFGVDGNIVLMERGTKLIGETRGQVTQGAARIFVLWTEARTPSGVVVPLDSPGADELGRSGLSGEVNHHFWQRFGAAMLVSIVDGAVQAAVQSSRSGSGNVVLNPASSQDVLTEILKNTINVPPTIVKPNGDRIQVLVARDVDFRSVYQLRAVAAEQP